MSGRCALCRLWEAIDTDWRAAVDELAYAIGKGVRARELAAECQLEELRILRGLLVRAER